jgi:hypothetical protein
MWGCCRWWPGDISLLWEALAIIFLSPGEMEGDKDNENPNGNDGIALRLVIHGRKCDYVDPICDHKKSDNVSFYRKSPDHAHNTC